MYRRLAGDVCTILQVQRFEAGERQRYFADDDRRQLKDLVSEQRYEGAADMDANLADNILRKGKRFRYLNKPALC